MKPTQDQVIAWAREAGFDWSGKEISWEGVICTNELQTAFALAYEAGRKDNAETAIAEAYRCGYEAGRKDENEACAKMCEEKVERASDYQGRFGGYGAFMGEKTGSECADAIRARREQ